jgi:hypothetical protein
VNPDYHSVNTFSAETAFIGTPEKLTGLHNCQPIQSCVLIQNNKEIEKLNSTTHINPIPLLHPTLLHHPILFLHPNHRVLLSNSHHLLISGET